MGQPTGDSSLYFRQRREIFLAYHKRPDRLREPTNPPIKCVLGDVSSRRDDDISLQSGVEFKMLGAIPPLPHILSQRAPEPALLFSLIFPIRATRPSRVRTIKLSTHYCEEYLDLRKIKGGTWRELYKMNLEPSEVTRPLYGSQSFSFCRSIKRLQNGAESFSQLKMDRAMNLQQVAYLSPRRLKHNIQSQ